MYYVQTHPISNLADCLAHTQYTTSNIDMRTYFDECISRLDVCHSYRLYQKGIIVAIYGNDMFWHDFVTRESEVVFLDAHTFELNISHRSSSSLKTNLFDLL